MQNATFRLYTCLCPEDEGSRLLRIINSCSSTDTMTHPRRRASSSTPLWEIQISQNPLVFSKQYHSSVKCVWCLVVVDFFFFHWHYSPLWALACRTMSFHFFLSATNSLHLLTPSTWRSLSTSSFHPFLGLPLLLVSSSSWVKIFLGILSSSILSRWANQLILCPFIHFNIFSPLVMSSSGGCRQVTK